MPTVIEEIAGMSESEMQEMEWPSRDRLDDYFTPLAADGHLGWYSGKVRGSVSEELAERAYNLAERL